MDAPAVPLENSVPARPGERIPQRPKEILSLNAAFLHFVQPTADHRIEPEGIVLVIGICALIRIEHVAKLVKHALDILFGVPRFHGFQNKYVKIETKKPSTNPRTV
jgi:hypothetical protein